MLQPGSSVATALSEGESKKKHVFVLEILREQFRVVKLPLDSVRPFVHETVVLGDQLELDPAHPEVRSLSRWNHLVAAACYATSLSWSSFLKLRRPW